MPPGHAAALNVQIAQSAEHAGVKPIEELADGEAVPPEGNDRINGQLAGAMDQAAAAAVDPADLDLPVAQQRRFAWRLRPASRRGRR